MGWSVGLILVTIGGSISAGKRRWTCVTLACIPCMLFKPPSALLMRREMVKASSRDFIDHALSFNL
jgi:hypothetical protein